MLHHDSHQFVLDVHDLWQKYLDYIDDWSPVDPISCDWIVLLGTDNAYKPNGRNIKIYARPLSGSTFSEYTLSYEGSFNFEENEFQFYSIHDLIEKVKS